MSIFRSIDASFDVFLSECNISKKYHLNISSLIIIYDDNLEQKQQSIVESKKLNIKKLYEGKEWQNIFQMIKFTNCHC